MTSPRLPAVSDEMTDRAFAALRHAVNQAAPLDAERRRMHATLDYLPGAIPEAWGLEQFRTGLAFANETARWLNCNASLNAIDAARRARAAHVLPSGWLLPPLWGMKSAIAGRRDMISGEGES